jgi:two-component system KDP operon response regulator KdpE
MGAGRILVVDDDPQLRRVMRVTLIAQGYEVSDARNGEEALDLIRSGKLDLVLLDVNLPRMTGIETCREIRLFSEIPVIMMTVRNTEEDKIKALDGGADDYVTKPFSAPEMQARIRAALRRKVFTPESGSTRLRLEDVEIDFRARRIITADKQVRLTSKEFDLLSYFASNPHRPITHRELLQAVWGPDYGNERQYLRVFVNRLRKKIEPSPEKPRYLLNEPWVGYRFDLPNQ